tara:strand:+ start:3982 stop:4179 length:198 start_codon:yes stop_codon:yes gene_type:complete
MRPVFSVEVVVPINKVLDSEEQLTKTVSSEQKNRLVINFISYPDGSNCCGLILSITVFKYRNFKE